MSPPLSIDPGHGGCGPSDRQSGTAVPGHGVAEQAGQVQRCLAVHTGPAGQTTAGHLDLWCLCPATRQSGEWRVLFCVFSACTVLLECVFSTFTGHLVCVFSTVTVHLEWVFLLLFCCFSTCPLYLEHVFLNFSLASRVLFSQHLLGTLSVVVFCCCFFNIYWAFGMCLVNIYCAFRGCCFFSTFTVHLVLCIYTVFLFCFLHCCAFQVSSYRDRQTICFWCSVSHANHTRAKHSTDQESIIQGLNVSFQRANFSDVSEEYTEIQCNDKIWLHKSTFKWE